MITLLNGEQWEETKLLDKMEDDSFYYGHLGQYALSSSSIKQLNKSPKAYVKSLRFNSNAQPLRDGRLIHLNILEPHKMNDLVVIESTKAAKVFKDAVKEHGEANVYTQSEVDNAYWIAKAVQDNADARELLKGCQFELPAIKMIDGIAIRGKADAIKQGTIIDVKSTTNIAKFRWSAQNFDYDLQAALYMQLFDVPEFIFLVVDKDTKDIAIYDCSDEFINSGWKKLESGLSTYKYVFQDNNPKELIPDLVTYGTL